MREGVQPIAVTAVVYFDGERFRMLDAPNFWLESLAKRAGKCWHEFAAEALRAQSESLPRECKAAATQEDLKT